LLDGVAHHLYNGGNSAMPVSFNSDMSMLADMAAANGKPLFMTEFGLVSDVLGNAWLISNALTVEGVSAYYVWSLIWPPPTSGAPGGLVSVQNPKPGPGQPPFAPPGYSINDSYYAVKHFSKWIDVGWQRVAFTTSLSLLKASAFVSPDGQQVTLVVLN